MFDYDLLEALASVVRTGSFDRAAKQLHVTPSAISQRVKLLEERVGTVLVVRGQPCEATEAGLRLCQHLEQVALMEGNVRDALPGNAEGMDHAVPVRIAINADSLDTWFVNAIAELPDVLFDVVVDDQDHSDEWLRRGEVAGAVTSRSQSIQGCDSKLIGNLRYQATASPAFIEKFFPDGQVTLDALKQAPCMIFDRKDQLQYRWMKQVFGQDFSPPSHWLPSTNAFVKGALAGIGWGMNPELLVADHIASGRLAPLVPGTPFDVPLYWQANRVAGASIAKVSEAVLKAGRAALRPNPTNQR